MGLSLSLICVLLLLSVVAFVTICANASFKIDTIESPHKYTLFEIEEHTWRFLMRVWIIRITFAIFLVLYVCNQLVVNEIFTNYFHSFKSFTLYSILFMVIALFAFKAIFFFTPFNKADELFSVLSRNFPHGYVHDESLASHRQLRQLYLLSQITTMALTALTILLLGLSI